MAIFTKAGSYAKQVALFLKNGDYAKAYALAREMADAFPGEMISHFLLAKSAFWMEKYTQATESGFRAFNMAKERNDMITCAVLVGNARFMQKEYDKGLELLRLFEKDENEDVERMLVIFASVMGRDADASRYVRELMKINSKSAFELIERFLGEA